MYRAFFIISFLMFGCGHEFPSKSDLPSKVESNFELISQERESDFNKQLNVVVTTTPREVLAINLRSMAKNIEKKKYDNLQDVLRDLNNKNRLLGDTLYLYRDIGDEIRDYLYNKHVSNQLSLEQCVFEFRKIADWILRNDGQKLK